MAVRPVIRLKAFTLIELLLIITIIGIMGGMSAPFLSSFVERSRIATTTNIIVRSLRKAQAYSISGKENSEWGVHYEQGALTLFKGTDYATRDPSFDENFSLSEVLQVTGLDEVYFGKLRGEPSITISAVVTSPTQGPKTITGNSEGMFDVQ